ncbi:MAG: DinB family protein [Saprospiraceae bacterium]|nr:DinB family protein [Saprospiraceae bacterium]
MLHKPHHSEIPDFQQTYIDKTPDDIIPFLVDQKLEFINLIDLLDEEKLDYCYEENKWSLREVIMHINDTEQIFAYRALAIHRGEKQVLPGFDQDEYMNNTSFNHLDKNHLSDLFDSLRNTSIHFFNSIRENEWTLTGKISDYSMPLYAMPYMIGGHLEHHLRIIKERYISL